MMSYFTRRLITILTVPFILIGQYYPLLAQKTLSAESPSTSTESIMVLKRTVYKKQKERLLDEFETKGFEPVLLDNLNVITVQLPNEQLQKGLAKSRDEIAEIMVNKPVRLKTLYFPEKQTGGGNVKPIKKHSSSTVKHGLEQLNQFANQMKLNDMNGTIGVVSAERVGGTARSLITHALGKLSMEEIPSVFLSGKPLSGVNILEEVQNTSVNKNSKTFKQFQKIAKNHENWYEGSAAGMGSMLVGLISAGGGAALIGYVKSIPGLGGLGLLPMAGAGLVGVLTGLGFLTFGLSMYFQEAFSPPGNEEGRNPRLELDKEQLRSEGITLAMIGETHGVLGDGLGQGRDDQSWWNPGDWIDGKTSAYTVVPDSFVQHSFRMIQTVNQILDNRTKQFSKK